MKRRLLSILLVLMVVFGLIGCDFTPKPEDFVGEWWGFAMMKLGVYDDFTWTYGQINSVFDRGTWFHNGDNTITLIRDDGYESIAKKGWDKESDRYYLILDGDGDTYWKK